ncbi:hypothetical protein HQ865_01185 [Mucilaginibacter mali]|uniref:Uncharacterized protein n=1 Tax=Mucilaginibacter mali TaxID=2740462 RepID=A0A7D4PRS0_9SPHI|nr:hypothetical protein [Mucilaginibacter mali]QKJ28428.1 hypothetical protein HQ865_01185 [Mucilaginibacter mali]
MKQGWSSILILVLIVGLAYAFYKWVSGLTFGKGGDGDGSGANNDLPADQGGKSNGNTNDAKAPTGKATGYEKRPEPPKKVKANNPQQLHDQLTEQLRAKSTTDFLKPILPAIFGAGIFNKMPDNKLAGYNPNVQAIAKRLQLANHDAYKYRYTYGTTGNINKALDEVLKLSDADFIQSVRAWKVLDGFTSPFDTDLCSANIDNGHRSDFLGRIKRLGLI